MTTNTPLQHPVKPRDASSLIIYDKQASGTYVLMGKRAKAHRFLPNVFVFPGGRVDATDSAIEALRPLQPTVSKYLSNPGDKSHAIACAAARETQEETGLILGTEENGDLKPDLSRVEFLARAITPAHNPIRFNTRFLTVDANQISGDLGGSGELLELQWFKIEDALAMPLVDVTEFVLEVLNNRLSSHNHSDNIIPLFTYRNGKPLIRWLPH
ncbi:NUDIX hydrolase [Sneathiella limimaris]|uniref:NUDIX hydrolase n=1 Tax=Sneathiella limimaris TaxID=1964213 RepID=UPI00146D1147|nr:NUDIX hydrolase [Sneathiella limimaris]